METSVDVWMARVIIQEYRKNGISREGKEAGFEFQFE